MGFDDISHVISFKCQYINIPHTLHLMEGAPALPYWPPYPSPQVPSPKDV